MATEVELKLAVAGADHRRLMAHPLLRRAEKTSRELVNIYYDTPEHELRRHGIALRLRRQGREWLQTVKCVGETAAGLSSRPEWETPYAGHFDFAAVDVAPVRRRLERPRCLRRLVPVFETRFRRVAWRVEPAPNRRVMVMLDRGWIAADGRREEISEVEIELDGDAVSPIFDVAEALAETIPLLPAVHSKADRGYRLAMATTPDSPVKAVEIPVSAGEAARTAFRRIALGCLDHLQANHAGALASPDPEYIHQMRVAARRLRAALRIFRPVLPPALESELVPPLRALVGSMGAARDYDVLLHEVLDPVVVGLPNEPRIAALAGLITEHAHKARKAAVDQLAAPGYGRWLLHALRQIHLLDDTAADEPVGELAGKRLKRLSRDVRRRAVEAGTLAPAALHALRIAVKRLRYGIEFFAPIIPGGGIPRLARTLARTQDLLGAFNDLANAGALLMECADDDSQLREAVSLIGGWHGAHHATLTARIPHQVRAMAAVRIGDGETRWT